MKDKIRIVTLGGQDEFGKMVTLIEVNDDIFVVECGEKKPDRTRHGVDYVIANFDYLLENKHKVRAYFLTHGNDQAIGGLAFIYNKIPAQIYCSDATFEVLSLFIRHNRLNINLDVHLVEPTCEFNVAGHRINFFAVTCSMARSSGISIHTSEGNIIVINSFVIDNDSLPDYYYDRVALAKLGEEGVLALLCEARYADRMGYTNPSYKLVPQAQSALQEAKGRIFVALETSDMYNITSIMRYGITHGRKIIFYDKETLDTFEAFRKMHSEAQLIKKENFSTIDTINQFSSKDVLVLMIGFGEKIYKKIALLATSDIPTKAINLNENDTFIVGIPYHIENEIYETDAVDTLYRTNAKVVRFNKNSFIRMHGSQEDIKTILSITKPKYFIPVYGAYRKLLEVARVALATSIGLNHNRIFVMDNGNYIDIIDGVAKLSLNQLPHGDIYVDGKGIGDISLKIIEERQRFGDDGVIILGVTLSKDKRIIYAGPDIQMRGFVYLKDSEVLLKEMTKLATSIIENHLQNDVLLERSVIEADVENALFRLIRRNSLKNPSIIPTIAII